MKRLYFIIVLSISILFTLPGAAEEMTIAVLDLTPKGVPRIVSNAVSDIIRSEFVNIGNFTVVERSQMKAILDEQGFQMTGCTGQECAVKFGRLLSARRIIIGEVNKVGKSIIITIRYVDVEKGTSMFSAREKSQSVDDVDKHAEKIAKKLAQRIVEGDKEVLSGKSPAVYYTMSIIPGLGQFYADKPVKGTLFTAAFIGAGVFTVFSVIDFNDKDAAYHDTPLGSGSFDSRYDEYDQAGTVLNISIIVLASVYAIHWVDVIFFSKPGLESSDEQETAHNSNYIHINIEPDIVDESNSFAAFTSGQKMSFGVGLRF